MALKVPKWLLGRHLTTINVYPTTIASDGTVTVGTVASLSGRIDMVRVSSNPALEQIMSVDDTSDNRELLYDSFTLELTEILTNLSGAPPVLPAMNATSDVMKVVFTRGNQTYTFYGIRGAFSDGVGALGKNSCTLTLEPKNVNVGGGGVASLVYA